MSRNSAMSLVAQFLGRQNTIPVPVPFVRLLGDYTSAAFLAQCLYWGDRTADPEGWFHKSHDEWHEELELSPDQVRRCVKSCGDMIEVKRKGVPAKNHYRANKEAVAQALENLAIEKANATTRCGETQHLEVGKPHGKMQGNPTASCTADPTSNTKITSEPTSEITFKEREGEGGLNGEDDHSLSGTGLEFLEETQTADGASAEAPGGASAGPAMPVSGPAQRSPEARDTTATSTENVPPGAAGSARAALLVLFGSQFLATLLAEAPGRAGWLALAPPRIAELHQTAQAAVSTSPGKPWRTPLINALDGEAARNANVQFAPKPAEERTREEWLS